ncbi:MAG: Thiamine biosynthesis protein ThiF [Candidatus Woesebacteria bacterium GW2011_GWB1_38_5]|uniref:Thiamine biosynthesis protein ThiF n=1 Tax=Candidatus Woesebacteria bacterium GW2011_GWB1_38_5 TaxID=1618568 RepID=A0A0G0NEE5_9BACT|nr:MAG: Thiamine biosynthesis protein ThiF [Candidatus Woesebacteria bacterium GW2011_GWB1_38_5]
MPNNSTTNYKYLDFYRRNIGILTEDEQKTIKNARIAVLGCGGGSDVARQLTQSGFVNFLLADYDTVDFHNLNRQFYFQKDIGVNKAKALAENLHMINPQIKTEIWQKPVTVDNAKEAVEKSDFIIDAIPPETALKEEIILNREIRKYKNKYHLYFMDIVWGAKVLVFSNSSQTMEEFVGLKPNCDLSDADKLSLEELTKPYMENASSEMMRVGGMMYRQELSYFPQMAVTISLASSMVATLCIFLATGKTIRFAPHIYNIDYFKDFIGD